MNLLHKEKKKMSNVQSQPFERIIAALSYLTLGTVGFIYLLIAYLTKNNLKVYTRFHVFQSIFISIAYFLASAILGLVMNILSIIPFVNDIAFRVYFWVNAPLVHNFSIIQVIIYAILLYLILTCLQGKLSYLPWVSDIMKENVK